MQIQTYPDNPHHRTYHVLFPVTDALLGAVGHVPGVEPAPAYADKGEFLYRVEVSKGHAFDWELVERRILAVIGAYDPGATS